MIELENSIKRLAVQREQMQIWTAMQGRFIVSPIDGLVSLKRAIDEVLASLVSERDVLFDFQRGELWNFAVYLATDRSASTLLEPVWRQLDDRHPARGSGLGRSWGPGEGHVGKAFADHKPLITGDASHTDVISLLRIPEGSSRPYVASAYRSFASVPIGGGRHPFGILVATSDWPNRFPSEDDGCVTILVISGPGARQYSGPVAEFPGGLAPASRCRVAYLSQ